jgi:hypothetical protein
MLNMGWNSVKVPHCETENGWQKRVHRRERKKGELKEVDDINNPYMGARG